MSAFEEAMNVMSMKDAKVNKGPEVGERLKFIQTHFITQINVKGNPSRFSARDIQSIVINDNEVVYKEDILNYLIKNTTGMMMFNIEGMRYTDSEVPSYPAIPMLVVKSDNERTYVSVIRQKLLEGTGIVKRGYVPEDYTMSASEELQTIISQLESGMIDRDNETLRMLIKELASVAKIASVDNEDAVES